MCIKTACCCTAPAASRSLVSGMPQQLQHSLAMPLCSLSLLAQIHSHHHSNASLSFDDLSMPSCHLCMFNCRERGGQAPQLALSACAPLLRTLLCTCSVLESPALCSLCFVHVPRGWWTPLHGVPLLLPYGPSSLSPSPPFLPLLSYAPPELCSKCWGGKAVGVRVPGRGWIQCVCSRGKAASRASACLEHAHPWAHFCVDGMLIPSEPSSPGP